ncbi:Fanconi anemia core complex-associated protein 24 isoform X2 [Puntigrus tetrazona]|uniref:Fanconi anemia core complex-associated protein 24 isoform X2 n=1 Tax=Puntigrus tetrazona TaxID=1606681 RepID=UPI001C8A6A2B|nr:Fanconi anemia core complex-associated protein 24 isoform X2 [Puntigrus tetrazona]
MRVRHARIRRFYNVPQRSYVLSERASASVVLNARASVVMESKPVPAKLLYAAPPYGQMISHEKWRGSSLLQSIRGSVTTIFEEELGVVDFCLSNKTCILYVSESDLVAGNGYRRKIVQFRNANSGLQGIVIVEKTHLSEQYFSGLQKFVVLELGLTLLPVSSAAEAAQLIAQLVILTHSSSAGSRREQGQPVRQEERDPTARPSGAESGSADPWRGKGEGHAAPTAVPQHPSALRSSTA